MLAFVLSYVYFFADSLCSHGKKHHPAPSSVASDDVPEEPPSKKAKKSEPACNDISYMLNMEALKLDQDGIVRKPLDLQRVQGLIQKHLAVVLNAQKV